MASVFSALCGIAAAQRFSRDDNAHRVVQALSLFLELVLFPSPASIRSRPLARGL